MVYDYIIGGTGAAGLQLALAMAKDPFFSEKQILLIDASAKLDNDKRWCFWEEGAGQWDALISAQWDHVVVRTPGNNYERPLGTYRYKMLMAGVFYADVLAQLAKHNHIHRVTDTIIKVEASKQPVEIVGLAATYQAKHFFDSRVEEPLGKAARHQVRVFQHFRGWEVETKAPFFNRNKVELMDFNYAKPGTCSFMYVLPYNEHKALVEFTVFSPHTWLAEEYEVYLRTYLKDQTYTIHALEEGVIPMNTVPYHLAGGPFHTKIGTAGSWVKPSTGYSFKAAETKVALLIEQLKAGTTSPDGLINKRFRIYDRLLLDILARHNAYGITLFDTLYRKNRLSLLFRFLDEKTRFTEELRIMATFNPWPFMLSIARGIWAYIKRNV